MTRKKAGQVGRRLREVDDAARDEKRRQEYQHDGQWSYADFGHLRRRYKAHSRMGRTLAGHEGAVRNFVQLHACDRTPRASDVNRGSSSPRRRSRLVGVNTCSMRKASSGTYACPLFFVVGSSKCGTAESRDNHSHRSPKHLANASPRVRHRREERPPAKRLPTSGGDECLHLVRAVHRHPLRRILGRWPERQWSVHPTLRACVL
jgi:hypothetical protein